MKVVYVSVAVLMLSIGVIGQELTNEEKIAANKAWVLTTYVWMGDEKGSEDFTWEGTRVAVPRPPVLTVTYENGTRVITNQAAYKTWHDTWVLPYTEHPCDFSRQPGEMQVADWWVAKRWAYHSETGRMPKFIPPYPRLPGGKSPAAIG